IEPSNRHERVSADYLRSRLIAMQEFSEAGEELRLLSGVGGPLTWLLESFMQLPLATRADWEAADRQVQAVPTYLASMQAALEEGLRRGIVANRDQAESFADRCTKRGGHGTLGLFRMFFANDGPPYDMHDRMYDGIQRLRDAVAQMGEFVRTVYLPATRATGGVGAEAFGLHAAMSSGTGIDFRELYDWAWDQIAPLREEAEILVRKLYSGRSIDDVMWKLDADSGDAFGSPDLAATEFQDILDRALRSLAEFQMPDHPLVHDIELAAGWEGGYKITTYSPAPRIGEPARVWLPDSSSQDFPVWRHVGPFHFVSVPGLHLLSTYNRFVSKHLTEFQRRTMVPAHSFGWGLYVERLLQRIGYLQDEPGWELGAIQNTLLRTCRLIVDTGLHMQYSIPEFSSFHPGEVWNTELAVEFLRSETFVQRGRAHVEVRRSISWPSQLSSYKVGERAWITGLDACRAAAPDLSDLDVHSAALALGPLTTDQMDQELPNIADWMEPGNSLR
ncbi:MAG: DUF885 domain-containing protein, partial [Acidimicrobiales bacterium]